MIPMAFDYERPATTDGALQLLAEHGDEAKVLAGGHSLLPLMKLRLAAPAVLVDVGRLTELSYTRVDGDTVAIGALTRHCDVANSKVLQDEAPLIAHAAGLVGDPQIRHRGTIGGSIAHGDPASDLPTAVLATGGVLVARGPAGTREIDVTEFFVSFLETALQPDELLAEIRVPRAGSTGWAYQKFVRRSNDWAIVAAATVGRRVALANMGHTPLRAAAAERALAEGADVRAAAELAADGTSPAADMHASVEYRNHLARLLTRRALQAAS